MNLPPEAIAEFKQIFYQERGVLLSDEDAKRLAHELFALGKTVVEIATRAEGTDDQQAAHPNAQSLESSKTAS